MDSLSIELGATVWLIGTSVALVFVGFYDAGADGLEFLELFVALCWPVVLVLFVGYSLVVALEGFGQWLARICGRSRVRRRGW